MSLRSFGPGSFSSVKGVLRTLDLMFYKEPGATPRQHLLSIKGRIRFLIKKHKDLSEKLVNFRNRLKTSPSSTLAFEISIIKRDVDLTAMELTAVRAELTRLISATPAPAAQEKPENRAMLPAVVDELIANVNALQRTDFSSPNEVGVDFDAFKRKLVEKLQLFRNFSAEDAASFRGLISAIKALQDYFAPENGKTFDAIKIGLEKLIGEVRWITVEGMNIELLRRVPTWSDGVKDPEESRLLGGWLKIFTDELVRFRDSQEKTKKVLLEHIHTLQAIVFAIKASRGESAHRGLLIANIEGHCKGLEAFMRIAPTDRAMLNESGTQRLRVLKKQREIAERSRKAAESALAAIQANYLASNESFVSLAVSITNTADVRFEFVSIFDNSFIL